MSWVLATGPSGTSQPPPWYLLVMPHSECWTSGGFRGAGGTAAVDHSNGRVPGLPCWPPLSGAGLEGIGGVTFVTLNFVAQPVGFVGPPALRLDWLVSSACSHPWVGKVGCPQLRRIRLSPQHLDWRLALPLAMAGVADPLDSCRLIWLSKCSEKSKSVCSLVT